MPSKQSAPFWLEVLAVWLSLLTVFLFVASYWPNSYSGVSQNYYRFLYGLVPAILPLLLRWLPLFHLLKNKWSVFLLVCLFWCVYLIGRGDTSKAYYGLTVIALVMPFLLMLMAPSGSSSCPSGFEKGSRSPLFVLPTMSRAQWVLIAMVIGFCIYFVIIASSGSFIIWLAGIVFLFGIVSTYRFTKMNFENSVLKKLMLFTFLFIFLAILVIKGSYLILDYRYLYGNYVRYLWVDDAYPVDKENLSPMILVFYMDYVFNGQGNVLMQDLNFFPMAETVEFTYGGDFGWIEYVREFGLITMGALALNFYIYLSWIARNFENKVLVGVCLCWGLLLLNGHYGLFYSATGIVTYLLMLIGIKVLGGGSNEGTKFECRK